MQGRFLEEMECKKFFRREIKSVIDANIIFRVESIFRLKNEYSTQFCYHNINICKCNPYKPKSSSRTAQECWGGVWHDDGRDKRDFVGRLPFGGWGAAYAPSLHRGGGEGKVAKVGTMENQPQYEYIDPLPVSSLLRENIWYWSQWIWIWLEFSALRMFWSRFLLLWLLNSAMGIQISVRRKGGAPRWDLFNQL